MAKNVLANAAETHMERGQKTRTVGLSRKKTIALSAGVVAAIVIAILALLLRGAPRGLQGVQGLQGPVGEQGPKGDNGAIGPAGPRGQHGDNGATGPQGPKGDTGATGPQGRPGDNGATGPQGPKGDNGATGSQGPPGENGKDANVKADIGGLLKYSAVKIDSSSDLYCIKYTQTVRGFLVNFGTENAENVIVHITLENISDNVLFKENIFVGELKGHGLYAINWTKYVKNARICSFTYEITWS